MFSYIINIVEPSTLQSANGTPQGILRQFQPGSVLKSPNQFFTGDLFVHPNLPEVYQIIQRIPSWQVEHEFILVIQPTGGKNEGYEPVSES